MTRVNEALPTRVPDVELFWWIRGQLFRRRLRSRHSKPKSTEKNGRRKRVTTSNYEQRQAQENYKCCKLTRLSRLASLNFNRFGDSAGGYVCATQKQNRLKITWKEMRRNRLGAQLQKTSNKRRKYRKLLDKKICYTCRLQELFRLVFFTDPCPKNRLLWIVALTVSTRPFHGDAARVIIVSPHGNL